MAQPARPLRADAVRNRARVLEVAYETFAAEGLSVPIDEIARRAGVGAGTVYRHFPTKEALFQAVIEDRMQHLVDDGYAAAGIRRGPARRCSAFCARWCCSGVRRTAAWPTRWQDLESTSRRRARRRGRLPGPARRTATRRAESGYRAARRRRARGKSIVVGCLAMEAYDPEMAERVTDVVIDGLRAG